MSDFWNRRYDTRDYVYGVNPNRFFQANLLKLPAGRLLLPAEGEGRNAVFAAQAGWEVEAFDISSVAKTKAMQLATKAGVDIHYEIGNYYSMHYPEGHFDLIALIYAHQPSQEKASSFRPLIPLLKKGGYLLFEGFSKEHVSFQQENKSAGGPRDSDMLYSKAEIASIFEELEILSLGECLITLDEGHGHKGQASVIRMIGRLL